jgi:hypothetical protein
VYVLIHIYTYRLSTELECRLCVCEFEVGRVFVEEGFGVLDATEVLGDLMSTENGFEMVLVLCGERTGLDPT